MCFHLVTSVVFFLFLFFSFCFFDVLVVLRL